MYLKLKFSRCYPIRQVMGGGGLKDLQDSSLVPKESVMAGKVIDLNEYRKARMVEEYAAAIVKCDIENILRNCGFDPDVAHDYLERNMRRHQNPDPDDRKNDPADSV